MRLCDLFISCIDQTDFFSSGKRGIKRPWTKSAEEFLRRTFKSYLTRKAASVHNTDIMMAQNSCAELSERSKAQIRSKLNNMKLGKSKYAK